MNIRFFLYGWLFFHITLLSANAAAPTATYLFPAGGQRGSTVEVTVGGVAGNWPTKIWTSHPSITATALPTKGKLKVVVAPETVPGTYWIRLFDDEGASTLRPFMVGTLPEALEVEPNDEISKSQKIDSSRVINGKLEKAGDVDIFSVALKKGNVLVSSLQANHILKSPVDSIMQIVDEAGFVLETNHDNSELDPRIIFTAPQDGTYRVRVFGFPSMPDSSIRFSGGDTYIYRLTLTTQAYADYAAPLAVHKASKDPVEIVGWNMTPATQKLALPEKRADDFATLFHATLANPIKVRLEDHPSWEMLRSNPMGRPELLTPPFSVTGGILKAPANQRTSFTAKKGQAYHIAIESRELGFPLTPVVRVLDEAGKEIVRAEPAALNKDVTLRWVATADGKYQIEVSDLHRSFGPRFIYLLRVTPPEPSFDLTLASDRLVIPPMKPLDVPVTIVRNQGFTGDIELEVPNLPAGVTAQVVPPMGKGDAKTMTLRLTCDAANLSVPIQIVGKSKEKTPRTRTAQATIPELETTSPHLWLTVSNSPVPKPKTKKR